MEHRDARYERHRFIHPEDGRPGWWLVRGWKNGFLVQATSAQEAYLKVKGQIVNPSTAGVEWLGTKLSEVVELGDMR
jgi:hypothetical protein